MTKKNENQNGEKNSFFMKLKSNIVSLAALLVVIPSVINAGKDIYISIMNIPLGASESKNERLKNEHWDERAITKQDIEIKNNKFLKIRVYDNADVWLGYGRQEQWFSNAPKSMVNRFTLISSAYAEEVMGLKTNSQVLKNKNVINEGAAEDSGVFEKTYLFAKTNNYHSSIKPKKKHYKKSYRAEEGYVFSDVKLDVETINHASTPKYKISDDKKDLTVEVTLESGPFYDRWRGWIKVAVVTTQVKG
ncbi:hypothetical protein MNBD_GAMMA08-2201 [hydrothermal vent metagenome]|uniref:Uncharacterized protein n=1 Tax=hydrothermal vent metagenome TaxID=652676 RepID=A0A3B0XYE0_9ZZZZ